MSAPRLSSQSRHLPSYLSSSLSLVIFELRYSRSSILCVCSIIIHLLRTSNTAQEIGYVLMLWKGLRLGESRGRRRGCRSRPSNYYLYGNPLPLLLRIRPWWDGDGYPDDAISQWLPTSSTEVPHHSSFGRFASQEIPITCTAMLSPSVLQVI